MAAKFSHSKYSMIWGLILMTLATCWMESPRWRRRSSSISPNRAAILESSLNLFVAQGLLDGTQRRQALLIVEDLTGL